MVHFKRRFSYFLVSSAAFFVLLFGISSSVFAADSDMDVTVHVTYGQSAARDMLEYINLFRAGNDVDGQAADYLNSDNSTTTDLTGQLNPLTYDYELERIAMLRAVETAMTFSHTRPNGDTCFSAWSSSWTGKGENIAAGNTTVLSTFRQWREDDEEYSDQGHRRNMLSTNFTRIGIGHVVFRGVHYWTQAFGTGTGDDTATDACDEETDVTVTVAVSSISSISMSASPASYELEPGETADLPSVVLVLRLTSTWPSSSFSASTDISWSLDETEAAAIQDGRFTALALGTASLTGTLNDTDLTVPVTVAHDLVKTEAVDSTCISEGNTEYWTCRNCGKFFSDEGGTIAIEEDSWITERSSHTEETLPAVAPTCTQTGLTAGSKCSVCGEILTAQETVPATGHTAVVVPAATPTCTQTGLTEGSKCSVCGEILTVQETVPAAGHTAAAVPAVSPTCTETGLTEGSKCSVCGEILTAQETIPATGHDWDIPAYTWSEDHTQVTAERICKNDTSHTETETVSATFTITTQPTCTAQGLGLWTSGVFENTAFEAQSAEETVDALGHDYSEAVTAPTCTEQGYTTYTCARCSDSYTGDLVSATGHDWDIPAYTWSEDHTRVTAERICKNDASHVETETVSAAFTVTNEPTCTTEGRGLWTSDAFESAAFEVQSAEENIAATGHTPETVPTVAPTCTETGLTEGSKCSVCGEILTAQETVPATGHTAVAVPAVSPTCTETGLTEGSKCSVCGEILTAQETVPATGHDWDIPAYTWSEDHTRVTAERICKNDASHVETETVSAHVVPDKEPNCTKEGSGKWISDAFTNTAFEVQYAEGSMAALGHTSETIPAVAPTCTQTGLTAGSKCSVCGEILTAQKPVPATGHTPGAAVRENIVASTYTSAGSYDSVTYCTVCGKELSRTSVTTAKLTQKANTLTVTAKSPSVKYSKLKKKAQVLKASKAYTVKKAKGTVTYKLKAVKKAKFKKYFKVNSATGAITIKKGLKKGTYKLSVIITAAGNTVYKSASKTATITLKVK